MHSKNDIGGDARFSKIFRDSKFKNFPKRKGKVKIDKRFQSMFTDGGFQVTYSVDKRGRRISKTNAEDLNKFYHISTDESDNEVLPEERSEDSENLGDTTCRARKEPDNVPALTREEEDVIKKKQISGKVRQKLKDMNVDYARGEGKLFSESSSDESESEESEPEVYHHWNELDKEAENTENVTKRLAVCNMDWDRVRALDLMALFKSFLSSRGAIHSVAIYTSDFGLKRLAEEEVRGPTELTTLENYSVPESDSDDGDEEGKRYHVERMREYQLNRLKYYYAVATFDSPQTADEIYSVCNGIEYCKSGILLDLRFIDDDMTFDQEPKDICHNIDMYKYKPLDFVNTALQQTKVELTWDETDPLRRELTQNITEAAKKGDINDSDLEGLVALSSSDDEEDALLEALKENSTLEEFSPFQHLLDKRKAFKMKREEQKNQEKRKHDIIEEDSDSTKKKSKKLKQFPDEVDRKQKGELELILMDENEEDRNRSHFNLKRKKHKFRKDKTKPLTDDFEVNVDDERFSALYSSHSFNIDPTNSNYHKTKGMQAFVQEKQKRLSTKESNSRSHHNVWDKSGNTELSLLVKSIKKKTKSHLEKCVKNKINKELT